ncbi:unnamed protein product, partial [Ectocarpus fasciculatus]
ALRLDLAQGHHPQGGRHPHCQGRDRRHRRVLRPRGGLDLLHRHGHHLQHGGGDRGHVLHLPVQLSHAGLPRGDGAVGDRVGCQLVQGEPPCRRGGPVRRGDRDRPRQAAPPRQRALHA